jgi:hypothetical protein
VASSPHEMPVLLCSALPLPLAYICAVDWSCCQNDCLTLTSDRSVCVYFLSAPFASDYHGICAYHTYVASGEARGRADEPPYVAKLIDNVGFAPEQFAHPLTTSPPVNIQLTGHLRSNYGATRSEVVGSTIRSCAFMLRRLFWGPSTH